MKLSATIEVLERHLGCDPILFTTPDGTIVKISGRGDPARQLLRCVFDDGYQTPEQ